MLDKRGGRAAGSTSNEASYQDRHDELLIAENAAVRRAWRAGGESAAYGIPSSSAMMLPSVLPAALPDAVHAHFGLGAAASDAGANDKAAGIEDSGDFVSR